MPRAAERELMDDPGRMGLDIIELRAYAGAKRMLKDLPDGKEPQITPAVVWVFDVQRERKRRRMAKRRKRLEAAAPEKKTDG